MIRQQRGGADQQVMCVGFVLIHVGVRDVAATARFVNHRDGCRHQLQIVEHFFDRATSFIVAATGGGADDNLDVFLRRPALRLRDAEACHPKRNNI